MDLRFIHILNCVVLKMAESLQDRPEFYNSTRGAKKWHSKVFNMVKTNKWIPKFIGSVMIVHVKVQTSSGEPVIILKETPHNLHGIAYTINYCDQ